jgi:hypothetical protein
MNLKKEWKSIAFVVGVLSLASWLIWQSPQGARGQPTIAGPIATNVVVGTTSAQIVAANPSRTALSVCNGGNANLAAIAPVGLTPLVGATGLGVVLPAGAGQLFNFGCFTTPIGAPGAGAAWNGVGGVGGQQLIVLEWFGVPPVSFPAITNPLPIATNTVVGASSTQIVGANASRRALIICNGSSVTNAAAIAPSGLTPSIGATGLGIQLPTGGGCFNSPPGMLGAVGAAWNGIGAAGGQQIIVLEW